MKTHLKPFGTLWELVISTASGAFAVLFMLWERFQFVRSRLDVGRQKLALKLSALIQEKPQLLEKVSLLQKEHEGLGHGKMLKTVQVFLPSENTQLEREEHKYDVWMGQHQENRRTLGVEKNEQVDEEANLSQVEEKFSHITEELETYRKQAKYLEEELERTIHFYQGQIISTKKKAYHSELAAWIAERNLHYLRKQNARNAQKLTEKELQLKLLEKDPYALDDVSNRAFGRKHYPNEPSPLGQPSTEMRPSHREKKGPLLLSTLVPVGGGRGSRSPRNPLDCTTSEQRRASSSYERLSDPPRAPLETGPLSPPWEQAQRTKIPVRGPFLPVDPRSQFMRRGPFFPPPPPGNMYGAPPEYFPPGPPPPPFPMQNDYSPRCFPQYLPPRPGFPPTPAPTPTPTPTPAF